MKFSQVLRTNRIQTLDPETGKGMTQPQAAALIGCNLSTYRKYEHDKRLPHPMFRKEILRIWPNTFHGVTQ